MLKAGPYAYSEEDEPCEALWHPWKYVYSPLDSGHRKVWTLGWTNEALDGNFGSKNHFRGDEAAWTSQADAYKHVTKSAQLRRTIAIPTQGA